jgi:hypothetical protein
MTLRGSAATLLVPFVVLCVSLLGNAREKDGELLAALKSSPGDAWINGKPSFGEKDTLVLFFEVWLNSEAQCLRKANQLSKSELENSMQVVAIAETRAASPSLMAERAKRIVSQERIEFPVLVGSHSLHLSTPLGRMLGRWYLLNREGAIINEGSVEECRLPGKSGAPSVP